MLSRLSAGARQMLAVQLVIAVLAVALAGWTLGVTNDLIRERDRLRTRNAQLEEALVTNDVVVPSAANVVERSAPQRSSDAYPPSISGNAQAVEARQPFNPGQIIGDLFTPAPPMRLIVLHARGEADARVAEEMARAFAQVSDIEVRVSIIAARDQRASGYTYFDGRQSCVAASLMQNFYDLARRDEVAQWSAQMRGLALPAQGEYAADRMDIILPSLPAPPAPVAAPSEPAATPSSVTP
jgi:hypothetical protein